MACEPHGRIRSVLTAEVSAECLFKFIQRRQFSTTRILLARYMPLGGLEILFF